MIVEVDTAKASFAFGHFSQRILKTGEIPSDMNEPFPDGSIIDQLGSI